MDPNALNKDGLSALHLATMTEKLDVMQILFTVEGLDVNLRDGGKASSVRYLAFKLIIVFTCRVSLFSCFRPETLHCTWLSQNKILV